VVEKREAPAEAAEAPEAQDQTEDEEAAVEPHQPMIEVGFCKFSLRVKNVWRDHPSNPFIPPLYCICTAPLPKTIYHKEYNLNI
jgi:hypothetical protein